MKQSSVAMVILECCIRVSIHVACNIRLVRLEYTFMIDVAQVKLGCCRISMFMFQVSFS
jgi:hypothetical protein